MVPPFSVLPLQHFAHCERNGKWFSELASYPSVCYLAEIRYDHICEGCIGRHVEIGTGSRNSPPGGVVSKFWGHVFTKFGV